MREYADPGDLRFAAELGSHAVFADPAGTAARVRLAVVLERLGYGSRTPRGATASWSVRTSCATGSSTPRSSRAPGSPRR
ncbi:alkyl sulfatase dimerization domain-containing protein [Rhodococcus phenolicus]|uniref:alkyl sulfatase dimerization domain-containing protein n=1 Tax=Rhodococcus phenolicus TaxID=263849 RepID=UPI001FE1F15C|nr:alkyl sulfatase dimerization domain-containing protein [Rhodococcus phenolicus]